MTKRALTVREASEAFGIGHSTLRTLIAANRLPAIYVGSKALILTRDLEMFLALNRGIDLLKQDEVRPLESGSHTYEELCG